MSFTRASLALLGLAALTAVVVPWQIGLLVMAGFIAAAVADAWSVRRPPEVQLVLPPVLSRATSAHFAVRVSGHPRPPQVYLPGGAGLHLDPSTGVGHVSGTIEATVRGLHGVGPVATRSTGPLGLGCWYHQVGSRTEIPVFPDMPAARRLAMAVRTGTFAEEGRSARGRLGMGTDFDSIRDYAPDDDFRHLNWRASARTGRPMTNTYRVDRDRDVICLLDHGRLMAAPITNDSGVATRLDYAVDTVAAIAAVADEIGDRAGVVTFADTVRDVVRPRRRGADAVLAAIFDLQPSDSDSDYERAFQTVVNAKRAMVLILTDLLDEAAARPLLRAVPILARHHALIVAGVSDARVEALVSQPASDLAGATKTSVAVTVLEERDHTIAALRHLGATVIDAEPADLAARCVGGYLRAKNAARL